MVCRSTDEKVKTAPIFNPQDPKVHRRASRNRSFEPGLSKPVPQLARSSANVPPAAAGPLVGLPIFELTAKSDAFCN